MSQLLVRKTIVPLHFWRRNLEQALPLDLGHDVTVENLAPAISQIDMSVWDRHVSHEEQKAIKSWSVCLVHTYRTTPEIGKDEQESQRLLHYVGAHLRFLVPTRTNVNYMLQATLGQEDAALDVFRFMPEVQPLVLENCERLCSELELKHFLALKSWMPWILEFKDRWKDFYPLYLSVFFSEKAYLEEDFRARHLFRVMALEALFSSAVVYGQRALVPRLGTFIGQQTDLYERYHCDLQTSLPRLILGDVLEDVCRARNKIAHGEALPVEWLTADRPRVLDGPITHVDELREAATGMLALVWNKILNGSLQETFADKARLEAYFSG